MNNKNRKQSQCKLALAHCTSALSMLFLLLAILLTASCSDWNDIEAIDTDPRYAKEQNPELWARYMESLRIYKQERPHYITYGNFVNGIEQSKNEGAYLRSLPDSLDIVTLANSEKITAYDREDILSLHEKSTKVLYLVDYIAKMTELPDAAALSAWLDKAVATVAELNLDGFAFNGLPLYGGTEAEQAARKEAAQLIVSKLSAVGKMLVFEGDLAFVDAADLSKLDYAVLNTADIATAVSLKLHVMNVLETYTLPKEKLLLAAKIGALFLDEENMKQDAVMEMTNRVVSLGPLGGLAIYALGDDYYQAKMNYQACRTAIQTMNPSR